MPFYRGGSNLLRSLTEKLPFLYCRVEIMAVYITAHRQRLHRTKPYINWNMMLLSQHKHLPQVYEFSFPKYNNKFTCPFTGCLGLSFTRSVLRKQTNRMHWRGSIQILEDHLTPYPHFDMCILQASSGILNNQHYINLAGNSSVGSKTRSGVLGPSMCL